MSRDLLTADEEIALGRRVRAGDEAAFHELVERNLPLVGWQINRRRRGGDRDDLEQAGRIGLMVAARRYDPERGIRFATYAVWWIVRYLNDESRERALIRRPKYLDSPHGSHGNGAGPECLAASERAKRLTLGFERDDLLLVADDRRVSPLEEVDRAEQVEQLRLVLERLPHPQAYVLTKRAGLDEEGRLGLGAIGERLGLTKERVRQIEEDAIKHLSQLMGVKRGVCNANLMGRRRRMA